MRFEGTDRYVATDDLKIAINAAIALERPLLVKGEPGTGKSVLAAEVAAAIGAPLIEWHVKSTTKAQQGLYEYDAVSRLRDSQLGDARAIFVLETTSTTEPLTSGVNLYRRTVQVVVRGNPDSFAD
ncbi:MAG: AAA family ATPase, partial [Hyphomicrobiaceae bacterium]